jgi:hypothetical protein
MMIIVKNILHLDTRALFERALSAIPDIRSQPIWTKYVSYESQYGDLANLHKLQERRAQAFPQEGMDLLETVVNVAEKWSCYDIDYIGDHELGIPAIRGVGRKAPPTSTIKVLTNRAEDKGKAISLMGTANADKFARPDLSKWLIYKAEPGQAKGTIPVNAPISEDDQVMIPEPIFSLLNVLPKTAQGPIIPVDDLIRILLDSPIQAPLIPARMVPIAIDKNKKRKWDEGQ